MNWAMVERFGFPVACLIVVSAFLAKLMWYIIRESATREKAYREIITNHLVHSTDAQVKLVDTLTEFRKNVDEAHRAQRSEHIEMIKCLTGRK